jgi:predicted translin family RNA/ssDNA-binding protein
MLMFELLFTYSCFLSLQLQLATEADKKKDEEILHLKAELQQKTKKTVALKRNADLSKENSRLFEENQELFEEKKLVAEESRGLRTKLEVAERKVEKLKKKLERASKKQSVPSKQQLLKPQKCRSKQDDKLKV